MFLQDLYKKAQILSEELDYEHDYKTKKEIEKNYCEVMKQIGELLESIPL